MGAPRPHNRKVTYWLGVFTPWVKSKAAGVGEELSNTSVTESLGTGGLPGEALSFD